jgi:hypothetical protein
MMLRLKIMQPYEDTGEVISQATRILFFILFTSTVNTAAREGGRNPVKRKAAPVRNERNGYIIQVVEC